MPYTVSKNNAGEFCVYKQDANGDPMGDTLGCHKTQKEAGAQIGAIEAAEVQKMVTRPTQDEVNYTVLSLEDAKACANCRWFAKEGREGEYSDEIEGGYCHLIENGPKDVLVTGYCDRWEGLPNPPELAPTPVVIVEDERAIENEASTDKPTEYAVLNPTSNQKGFLQSLKERFSAGLKPGQTVFRDANGRRYMFIVTSNSYQDRENETIATKALERYVDSCWVADDYFKSNNVHQVWHHDGLTVGDIVWADMAGPFLVEVSKERDDIISKTAWDYWESDAGNKDLGASHRFLYRKQDKSDDGTLSLISKFETTTLPRQAAAANLLTFSGVIPMSKARDEYLDKMFGIDGAAELLKDGPQKLAEKLAEAGVEHKSTDEPTPDEAIQAAETNFGALILQLINAQAENAETMDKIGEQFKALSMQLETRQKDYDAKYEALAQDNAQLREQMKQAPRASEAPATVVKDAEAKKVIQEKQVSFDPRFPGMDVPMEEK
jgi:hypothetical protein